MIKSKYILGIIAFFGALNGCSAYAIGFVAWLVGIFKASENTPTMHPFAYTLIYSMPFLSFVGLRLGGAWAWATPVWIFGIVPVFEWLSVKFRANCFDCGGEKKHITDTPGAASTRDHWLYDTILYVSIPIQLALIWCLLCSVGSVGSSAHTLDLVGIIFSVGLSCGSLGINVAHELGHRREVMHHFFAKLLLSTVLYSHWFVEHNRGHHLRVATLEDPATSRRGENVYAFWIRSITGGVIDVRAIEKKRGSREVILWQLIQIAFVALIWAAHGPRAVMAFVLSSLVAVLLLETVNYIEHYGLLREKSERVEPWHSWNSNNVVSRMFLFELTHHSDHHANPKKPYARLRTHRDALQLPTGYAGMVIIALCPPLFFRVMHRRLDTK